MAGGQKTAEPTLADVLLDFWRARVHLFVGAIAGLAAAFIFTLLCVPQYKAEMLVGPAGHPPVPAFEDTGPESPGPVAHLERSAFDIIDSYDFMRFEAILRERSVAAQLLQDDAIKRGLAQVQRWKFLPAPFLDTPERLSAWLKDHVDIEPVGSTNLRRIVFRHQDPAFASLMVRDLYNVADALIRGDLQAKTDRRKAYLDKMVEETNNPDHKRALTKLLLDQEQVSMVLAAQEPFAATVVEPVSTGPKPDWPCRSLLFSALTFVGIFLGYAIHALKRR